MMDNEYINTTLDRVLAVRIEKHLLRTQKRAIDELKVELSRVKFLYDECRCDVARNEDFIADDRLTIQKLKSTVDALEAELSVRKQDSKVLMQVVEAVRHWHRDGTVSKIVKEYLDVPEVPSSVSEVLNLQLPIVGTRVVPKDGRPEVVISVRVMEAIHQLIECDENKHPWTLSTKADAHWAAQSKAKERLNREEIDRLRKIVKNVDQEIQELSELYCARCDQLEKIEKVIDKDQAETRELRNIFKPSVSIHVLKKQTIDEITKIIKED